jgi:hypothetical protein
MDPLDRLVERLAALPGIEPCRACATYVGDPTSDDDEQRWDIGFALELNPTGSPTAQAWRSLAFVAETVTTMTVAGRDVEVTIGAGRREGDERPSLYFSVDGRVGDVEPGELADWLHDLQRAAS